VAVGSRAPWGLDGPITAELAVPGGGNAHVSARVQVVDGTVTGTPEKPFLVGTATVTGTIDATVAGFATSVPISLSGVLGTDEGGASVSLLSTSCAQVTGEWTLDLRENAAQFSVATTGPASFLAFRTPAAGSAALEAFRTQVWQLEEDVSRFNAAVDAGVPPDMTELSVLLERSEELAADVPVARACADEPTGHAYPSMVAGYIRSLIGIALDHRDTLDLPDLLGIAGAGYRSGALGPGAPDPAASQIALLKEAVLAELDAAIGEGNDTLVGLTAVGARQFGWEDVVTHAVAAVR
jgi:hypothetical protein